jgi:hypothetical protein
LVTDEAPVPTYRLPDPLTFEDGAPVKIRADWRRRRRELLDLFSRHVYGVTPDIAVERTATVLDGDTRQRQTRLTLALDKSTIEIELLTCAPAGAAGPLPVVLIPNFRGNHTVSSDPGIRLSERARRDHPDLPSERGAMARRFPVEDIVTRGFRLVTYYHGDVVADLADLGGGTHPLFPRGTEGREDSEWGAVGAWAWGASRVLDHLMTDPEVDPERIVIAGHSRLGKAALWAAAQDERFAAGFANNSGCTGAALSRRQFGETVSAINAQFPHWFCRNYRGYAEREHDLPVDQHQLIALMAPRPAYVASASGDLWADPRGEYLGARHAGLVYELLGCEGLTIDEWPPRSQSSGKIGYHLRSGGHDLLAEDWIKFLDFVVRCWAFA